MANDMVQQEVQQEQLEFKSAGMSRNYFCVDCKCTTRNPRLYLEHRRDFHKEPISIHECDFCVYASRHSQKLARHMRTVHRDVVLDLSSQSMRNMSTNQSAEVIPDGFQPIQTGKNTRLSTCKLCGLYTINKTVLMEHIRTQHSDVRIYECDQCDYTHYIRDRYNRHHRYHSMNQIQCKLCEFQTIYRWNLERHMRHHIDSVSLGFRCKKCNFTVSTKQSITAHEIAHHSGIPFDGNVAIESKPTQIDTILNIDEEPKKTEEPNVSIETSKSIKEKCLKQDDDHENGNENNKTDPINVKQSEEEKEFDASEFLEVVLHDDSQPQPDSNDSQVKNDITRLTNRCSTGTLDWRNSHKTKIFHCINCSFRNEVDWFDGIENTPSFCLPYRNETSTLNSLYRCGYCHQTSQWKHVIERHCRLVHNTAAFIEKYSDQDERFKYFTPTKRRSDFSTETVTMLIKKPKDGNEEETNV